jgi:hypothetical protein
MPKRVFSSKRKSARQKGSAEETPESPARALRVPGRPMMLVSTATERIRPAKTEEQTIRRSDAGARLLQVPKRIWYNPLTWHRHPPIPAYAPLPKARVLFWSMLKLLWVNKRLFGAIVLVYGVLDIILVRGLSSSSDLSSIKNALDGAVHGVAGKVATSAISFTYLLANSGSSNTGSSGYQAVLLTLCSLAFIWAFRQVLAGHKVRMRDSFYQGMYPIIPFALIFLLMSIQLLPLAAGGGLYAVVLAGGIAVHLWEKIFWLVLFIVPGVWSFRMVTATIFAAYIVTLPDTTPLRAYRSARQLVYGRRLLIWRKFVFLPVVLLLLAALIEGPLILFATPIATWAFFIISMLALPMVHGYLYKLYREML